MTTEEFIANIQAKTQEAQNQLDFYAQLLDLVKGQYATQVSALETPALEAKDQEIIDLKDKINKLETQLEGTDIAQEPTL